MTETDHALAVLDFALWLHSTYALLGFAGEWLFPSGPTRPTNRRVWVTKH